MATVIATESRGVLAIVFLALLLGGCASATQQITRIEGQKPKEVCIVRHEAVKGETLEAIQEGFQKNGIKTRAVSGTYEQKDRMWVPKWNPAEVRGCDAIGFYVANWRWDLANYMAFANIWMVTPDGQRKIGQATYDAMRVAGTSKFINARNKLIELVDQMVAGAI